MNYIKDMGIIVFSTHAPMEKVFDIVTILFSDVVTFTEICSRISPMEVVSMLNAMYSIFDRLTELNGVYKVSCLACFYLPSFPRVPFLTTWTVAKTTAEYLHSC